MNEPNMTNSNKDILVIYHDNCLDGFGAAYAAWKKFGTTADYLPWNYGQDISLLPALNGKYIYVLDFSFPPDDIADMLEPANNITIIDHHKTFIDKVEAGEYSYSHKELWDGLVVYWDLTRSGAVLSWQFFHPNEPVPQLLLHIQDRDLWQFRLDGTKEICAALATTRIVERSWNHWQHLVEAFDADDREVMYSIRASGRAIIACQQQLIDECIATASEPFIDMFGFNVIMCNAPYSIASDLGNRIATEKPDCIAVVVSKNFNNGTISHSLRSVGDVDCTLLAKKFGGGGHKNAAGFTLACDD